MFYHTLSSVWPGGDARLSILVLKCYKYNGPLGQPSLTRLNLS
jgi:hypothetical protein